MTKTYYHATPYKNLESIVNEGIHKGIDGFVYLAETPDDAVKFLAIRFYTDIAVIEVDIESEELFESFDHNHTFFGCKAYIYDKDIDTSQIMNYTRYSLSY